MLARLSIKMKRTARALKFWSKTLFSDARVQFYMANELILHLDVAQETRMLSPAEFNLRKLLKLRVLDLALIERARKRQCSRITWLKLGDANTSFFHVRINSRRHKNFIQMLHAGGRVDTSHLDKEEMIADHCTGPLGSRSQRPCTLNWQELNIPVIETSGLDLPFTEAEVWKAIKASPTKKAPARMVSVMFSS